MLLFESGSKEFLDHTKWRKVIAEAVREAYSDIFIIKSKPTKTDRKLIAGKYKSTYNLSEKAADRAAGTFLSLLKLADEGTLYGEHEKKTAESKESKSQQELGGTPPAGTEVTATPSAPIHTAEPASTSVGTPINNFSGLHYNIQIHLPATKDIEVYNAIFKSIREHLID